MSAVYKLELWEIDVFGVNSEEYAIQIIVTKLTDQIIFRVAPNNKNIVKIIGDKKNLQGLCIRLCMS